MQGSSLTVMATCALGHQKAWSSQRNTNGNAAGNVLLAAAILFSGASAVNVLRMLASVSIEVFTASLYTVYKKASLVPPITKVMQHRIPQSRNRVVLHVQVFLPLLLKPGRAGSYVCMEMTGVIRRGTRPST